MPPVYWIQILEPGHPSRVEQIEQEIEVGRDTVGLLVDDPTVSRRHVTLNPTDVGLVVVDMGSANGTFIDGERMGDPIVLHPGSRLKLGETEIVVHEAKATEAGADAAEGATGAEVYSDATNRVSEEIRRLNAKRRP